MKTVTNNFEAAQRAPFQSMKRAVYYKRRYWDALTRAYKWESAWTLLPTSDWVSISPVNWKLDTDQLTEFKVSNVTLVVKNLDNRWLPDNRFGIFAPDSVSPLNQYEPYFMKFQIRAGFELYDTTEELVNVFTGVMAGDPVYNSENGTCQITVHGLEALLVNTKAESIATTITQENAGTANGVLVDFTTVHPGVGGVTLVTDNGITQIEGDDYTVSQLNESSLAAKITFGVAPTNTHVIRISYFYWPQSEQFEDLVALLLDAAGIASGDQLIDPVVFENSVVSTRSFTSQIDWDTGTKSYIETALSPGSLRLDFSTLTSLTTYTTATTGWTGTWTSDGTSLIRAIGNTSSMYRSETSSVGSWQFTVRSSNPAGTGPIRFGFCQSSATNIDSGYFLEFSLAGNELLLETAVSAVIGRTPLTMAINTDYTVKVTRYPNGRILVYLDGVLVIDVTNTTFTASSYLILVAGVSGGSTVKFKDIYLPISSISATWSSDGIDMSTAPTAWGVFEHDHTAAGATITYQTRTSADDITYDAWLDVSAQGVPQSTLRRYAEVRATVVMLGSNNFDPLVNSIDFRWVSDVVAVTLPEFAGISVYEALQRIGQFTLYEFGFTSEEDFFFRPKNASGSLMSLDQSNFISRVSGMSLGLDRVYGAVRVSYGDVTKEVTEDALSPESPTARVSNRRYEFSADSGIQIPTTADIATGVAQSLFKYLARPRKRLMVTTKFIPQLELSDVVTLRLMNNTPDPLWWIGDPTVYLGMPDRYLWGDPGQLIWDKPFKIISARYDLTNWNCEFEVEEVLS